MVKIPSWHMPDGTKTTNRPRDGTVTRVYDSKGDVATWQWDDVAEQWFNVSSGNPSKHNTATFVLPKAIDFITIDIKIGDLESVKCECGSDKVGSSKHSNWCKKFDPRT